jgi:hypothetical protein
MSTRSRRGYALLEIALLIALIAVTTAVMLAWVGGVSEATSDMEHVTGMEQFAHTLNAQMRDTGTVTQFTAPQLVASGAIPPALRRADSSQPVRGPRGTVAQLSFDRLFDPVLNDTFLVSLTLPRGSASAQLRLCQAYAEMGQRSFDLVRLGPVTLKQPGLAVQGADRIAAALGTHCAAGAPVVIQLGLIAG